MVARMSALQILLHALEEPGSCFVLGAGASAPMVPLAAQLGAHVRQRLLTTGSFSANPIQRDAISDRILGPVQTGLDPNNDAFAIEEEIVARHLSPAAVHAAAVVVLRPDVPIHAPPQYQVFSLAKHRLFLINFNNDGLASRYCSEHAVVNVHGTSLSVKQRDVLEWEQHIDMLQEYSELQGISIPGLLLPQREPREIAMTPQYRVARAFMRAARRLIVVGYSFGDMDDTIAYDLLTSTIRTRCIPTVIAKPDATDLVLRIAEDSKAATVAGLSVYWDKLASAIIASVGRPRHKSCHHGRLCSKCVTYFYRAFLDGVRL